MNKLSIDILWIHQEHKWFDMVIFKWKPLICLCNAYYGTFFFLIFVLHICVWLVMHMLQTVEIVSAKRYSWIWRLVYFPVLLLLPASTLNAVSFLLFHPLDVLLQIQQNMWIVLLVFVFIELVYVTSSRCKWPSNCSFVGSCLKLADLSVI